MIGGLQKTTNYRVVLPFYIYGSIGFLVGTLLLLFSTGDMGLHYFNPHVLAITHCMALAWGTMLIFGASHQLLPVMVEGKLSSDGLAYLSFAMVGLGIPLLIYGFYVFNLGLPLKSGAILINLGTVCYLLNVLKTAFANNKLSNVHAWFALTAAFWLFTTTFFGLLLVFNFQGAVLVKSSVYYLAAHAHLGIVGWFLLMVMGFGARLIPMFLISKYTSNKTLWWIYALINGALIGFLFIYLLGLAAQVYYLVWGAGALAVALFVRYCYKAYQHRIRKSVDQQVRTSLISVALMVLPFVFILILLSSTNASLISKIGLLYGFSIFFGWVTAIILGMTFKTMPFIVWNKVYHNKAHSGRTPTPKELFNEGVYRCMQYAYLFGFFIFITGIFLVSQVILKLGAILLLAAAVLYVYNMLLTVNHKPSNDGHQNK